MQNCAWCSDGKLSEILVEDTREVDGHLFAAQVPATRCDRCDVLALADEAGCRFDVCIAGALARAGAAGPQAFRRLRDALGLDAGEAAELCGVDAELVTLWETGRAKVSGRAAALVSALVRSKLEGREGSVDALAVLRTPRVLGGRVRLHLGDPLAAATKTLQFGSQARTAPALA